MIDQIKIHCRVSRVITRCVLHDMFYKQRNDQEAKDGVLVVFTPFIGDTILYLDVLRELARHYHSMGVRCSIMTGSQDKGIIEKYCEYDAVHVFEFVLYFSNQKYRNKYEEFFREMQYEKVVNPYFDSLLSADVISLLANGKEKIAADRKKIYPGKIFRKSIMKNQLRKRAYTKLIQTDDDTMDFMKQGYFMKEIGITDFQPRISYMEKTDISIKLPPVPYCIIAPGASKPGKRWETEKFAAIINMLVHKHNAIIYICGSKHENYICKEIVDQLDDQTKRFVINSMGKTTLLEYLELIRNARIVISNDSSPVHMAASVGTPCVCVIGGWDYHRLLPYVVAKEEKETRLPVPIYPEVMDCFNCFDHHVAYKNKQCRHCIKSGQPYPCISKISVEEVEKAAEQILRNQEGGK